MMINEALKTEIRIRKAELEAMTRSILDLVTANSDDHPSRHFGANLVAKAADVIAIQAKIEAAEGALRFLESTK